jgi:hypothetical protein
MPDEVQSSLFRFSRRDLIDLVELNAKVTLLVAGFAYGIGLVIVNAYLWQFGIVGTGLNRVEYVMAGLLWLFWLAFGQSVIRTARAAWRATYVEHESKNRPVRHLKAIFSGGGILVGGTMLSRILIGREFEYGDWRLFSTVLCTLLVTSFMIRPWGALLSVLRSLPTAIQIAPFSSIPAQLMAFAQYACPLCLLRVSGLLSNFRRWAAGAWYLSLNSRGDFPIFPKSPRIIRADHLSAWDVPHRHLCMTSSRGLRRRRSGAHSWHTWSD